MKLIQFLLASLMTTPLFGSIKPSSLDMINNEFVCHLENELAKEGLTVFDVAGLSNNGLLYAIDVSVNLYRTDIESINEAEHIYNEIRTRVYKILCDFVRLRPYLSRYPFPYSGVSVFIRCLDLTSSKCPEYPKIAYIGTWDHNFRVGYLIDGKTTWKIMGKNK